MYNNRKHVSQSSPKTMFGDNRDVMKGHNVKQTTIAWNTIHLQYQWNRVLTYFSLGSSHLRSYDHGRKSIHRILRHSRYNRCSFLLLLHFGVSRVRVCMDLGFILVPQTAKIGSALFVSLSLSLFLKISVCLVQ